MNETLKNLFLLAFAVLALGALFFAIADYQSSYSPRPDTLQEAPTVGFIAPDFTLNDVEGNRVELVRYRGKNPIFLNFWASWCPACREEAPQNEQLYRRMEPKGLAFLAVSIDRGPTAVEQVKKFKEELQLSFSPLLDFEGEVFERYGVTAIPTTFLIDRKGKIVAKEVGPKNWTSSEWLRRVDSLFK